MAKPAKISPAQLITDLVIERLKAGVRPWTRPWATGPASRPLRACGIPYTGINCLYLWAVAEALGYASPFWMTYVQAQELGGQVRKGAKSQPAILYKLVEGKADPDNVDDDGKRRIMRSFRVFNASQIDGLPPRFLAAPAKVEQPEFEQRRSLEDWFARVPIDVRHGGSEAYYSRASDHIQLPPVETFKTWPDYAATRGHEIIHATGHAQRLDRQFGKRFDDKAYAFEELVAETGAMLLGADLGLPDTLVEGHTAYIQHWLEILTQDATAILTAAGKAEQAVNWIKTNLGQPALPALAA